MGCFMDAEAALYLQAYEDKRYKEDNDFYLYEEFVFMTRWPFPCLQEDSVTGCTQAFGTRSKRKNRLSCDRLSNNGLMKNP